VGGGRGRVVGRRGGGMGGGVVIAGLLVGK